MELVKVYAALPLALCFVWYYSVTSFNTRSISAISSTTLALNQRTITAPPHVTAINRVTWEGPSLLGSYTDGAGKSGSWLTLDDGPATTISTIRDRFMGLFGIRLRAQPQ